MDIRNQQEKVEMGKLFKKAEQEIKEIASKYGFYIKLSENRGTWYFYPEVDEKWESDK